MTQETHPNQLDVVSQHGGCGCGCDHQPEYPVLDARAIPRGIRHGAIFGALDALRPGASMILVAPHDPIPLLTQAAQRYDGTLAVEYLQRGPQEWQLRLTR